MIGLLQQQNERLLGEWNKKALDTKNLAYDRSPKLI